MNYYSSTLTMINMCVLLWKDKENNCSTEKVRRRLTLISQSQ